MLEKLRATCSISFPAAALFEMRLILSLALVKLHPDCAPKIGMTAWRHQDRVRVSDEKRDRVFQLKLLGEM